MVPVHYITRQEKELKTLRKTRLVGRVSAEILEKCGWGKQERHRRVQSKARLGSQGKARSPQERPRSFHAMYTMPWVSSGYSARCYDYLTMFAVVLDWQRSPKGVSHLAEAADPPSLWSRSVSVGYSIVSRT